MKLRLPDEEIIKVVNKLYGFGDIFPDKSIFEDDPILPSLRAVADAQIKYYQDYLANMSDEEILEEIGEWIYNDRRPHRNHQDWLNLKNSETGKPDRIEYEMILDSAHQLLALSKAHELKAVEEARKEGEKETVKWGYHRCPHQRVPALRKRECNQC